MYRFRIVLLFAALLVAVTGCEWFSTMSRTVSIQPLEEEPIPPPEHSIPLGGLPRFNLATVETEISNPIPTGPSSLESGAEQFRIFCVPCHGDGGAGGGPVADKFPAIPVLTTGRLADFSDQYLFAVITQGRGLMPGYARIEQSARWDIVNYLRTLAITPSETESAEPAAPTAAGDEGQ